ncbi:MAG: hypothetical protein AAF449_13840 [Myxococcota bacterium]
MSDEIAYRVGLPSDSPPNADPAESAAGALEKDRLSAHRLTALKANEIDTLPFGYVALKADGTVLRYNKYESELARKDKQDVIGRNFFTEVAPCTQVQDFEGRFRAFAQDSSGPSSLSFDFVFAFRHGLQNVRIGLIRSPLKQEIIMTVNRRQGEKLALQPGVRVDAQTGEMTDIAGNRVACLSEDVWRAVDSVIAEITAAGGTNASVRIGLQWGMQQAFRVDRHLQRTRGTHIRDVSLGDAFDLLSKAATSMGIGSFRLDASAYESGLLCVIHMMSPFVEFFSSRENGSCAVLAGFHAGQLSYMSGRRLTGTEVYCSQQRGEPCRFIVATPERLDMVESADPSSSDGRLWRSICERPPSADAGR